MRPLLAVAALSLILSVAAHPENIEQVKELPQTKEPIVEAEESAPQARAERCTNCGAGLKLNLKTPGDILASIQALPGAEVHTQQSYESCSSDKGCAGLKVKDGKVVEKFGNVDAFKAAAQANSGEFQFHAGGGAFEAGLGNGDFWWMNQANSPFKNAGGFEKISKSSSSYTSSAGGAAPFIGGGGAVDLAANPFLNGDFSKLGANFGGAIGPDGKPGFSSSSFESSSFSSSSKGDVDLAKNPFLNGGIKFGQSGFGAQGFGAGGQFGAGGASGAGQGQGQSAFSSQSSFSQSSNSFGGQGAQGQGSGAGVGFGASGSGYNAASANKFSGSGYTGSSPSPFTASAGGANVNLIQNAQKASEFEFDQSQQTQQNIDEAFQSTGNVLAHEHSGGDLQQTCAGQGYVCVHKAQCNNGVVNSNGANVLQAKTQKQYCNTRTEICCRIEVSSLSGAGSLQGSLGVGSATFQGSGSQGSGLFVSQSGQASQSGSSFGQSGQASGNNFGQAGQSGFGANGFGNSGFGQGSQSAQGSSSFESSSSSFNSNSGSGFQGAGNGFQGNAASGSNGFQGNSASGFQGNSASGFQGNSASGFQGASFGSGSGSANRGVSGSSSFESGSSFNSNKFGASGSFGSGGSTVAPNRFAGGNVNEVYKSTSQSNFVETDSFSAGSQSAGVFRPGAGPGLKPGIPYLPPDNINQPSIISSTAIPTTPRPRPTTVKPTYLPPVSSTSAPGYLPPEVSDAGSSVKETRVPGPNYIDGSLILDVNRVGARPTPVPAPSEIPAGCAAALKCTPIEFCTAEGVISNTSVALTRDQEAYRVPLTDCKDLESGRIGKCCRDPFYTDPWPTNQLGKWVPNVFGGNDGKYVPDSKNEGSNRPTVTVRPPTTGSVYLNPNIPAKPTVPTFGPNQVTPGFPSSTASSFVQKGQFESKRQGQFGQRGQGQLGVQGQGQFSAGGQEFSQGGQSVTQFSQGSSQTQFSGQGGQKQFGVGLQGGQGQFGISGQGAQGSQGSFSTNSQAFGQKGQGSTVYQGQGQFSESGQGVIGQGGRGQFGVGGQGQFEIGGAGGQGQFTQFSSESSSSQSKFSQGGQGVAQGQGQFGQAGLGVAQGQGQGQFSQSGQGFGIRGQAGQNSVISQGGAIGGGSSQSSQGFGIRGQASLGSALSQGGGAIGGGSSQSSQGFGIRGQAGQGSALSQGGGAVGGGSSQSSQGFGIRGQASQGSALSQGGGAVGGSSSQSSQGFGIRGQVDQGGFASQGAGIISGGQGFGVRGQVGQGGLASQGGFGIRGQGSLLSQGAGLGIQFGGGSGVRQEFGQGFITGQGQGVSQGFGSAIRQGFGQAIVQGESGSASEGVYRVVLGKYGGAGQCGLLNGQKPYGNRNDLEVDFAEIPWQAMVLLQTNRSLLCGGVITRPDVVITSASCVEGLEAKNVLIKGGEWKLGIDDEPLPFQIVQVKHILRHPFYKSGSLKNDAAILVLSENLRLAKNIFPICLPGASETLDAFYNGAGECIVTGWGKQVLQAHLEGAIMHSLNVSLINPGECEAKLSQDYPHLLEEYDQESCACGQPLNPVNNICKVDTGSALACTTDNSHYVLRGIYSWDSGCQTGNQLAAFYKFDLEWYEWAIGLIESTRFASFSISSSSKVSQNRYSGQIKSGVKGSGSSGQFSSGVKGGASSGVVGGGLSGVKGFQSSSSSTIKGFGGAGAVKGFEGFEGTGSGQFGFSQFGQSSKFTEANSGASNFGAEIKGPISNSFSATYTEKKVFQTEPKFITYTTKPEVVTFTTKPEYYTFTTKPKIVTYTTKPQIIRYETSGSGTNPQYAAPSVSFNPSFSEVTGHKHNAQCKCLDKGKK